MTSITTIKIIFLITNLYMVNSYKICPKNSYYKVVDFSSNYDVKTFGAKLIQYNLEFLVHLNFLER